MRQGDCPATVYFNVLIVRVYKIQMTLLDGREALFAIADEVKICTSYIIIKEVVELFSSLAMKEAGLQTQVSKNIIYFQTFAQERWKDFRERRGCRSITSLTEAA
jgi:hypothetical protein